MDPSSGTILELASYDPASGVLNTRTVYLADHAAYAAPIGARPRPLPPFSVPPNTDRATPACIPGGTPVKDTPVARQLAAICLPDPAPGFPYQRGPAYYNDATERSFAVETLPVLPVTAGEVDDEPNPATATISIDAGSRFAGSAATTITPDSGRRLGGERVVGTATVQGVPATETVSAAGINVYLIIDGLHISANGTPASEMNGRRTAAVTFAQLIKLVDSLQGIRPVTRVPIS